MRRLKAALPGLGLSAVLFAAPAAGAGSAALSWELEHGPSVHFLWTEEERKEEVSVTNTGASPWSAATSDHLAYHWLGLRGFVDVLDGQRTSYAEPVPPGTTVSVEATLRAPKDAGLYILQWDLVRERVAWLGPPARGNPYSFVLVLPFAGTWLGVTAILTVLLSLLARKRWWIAALVPPLWVWLALFAIGVSVTDRLGFEPSMWLSASAAALGAVVTGLVPVRARRFVAAALVVGATFIGLADTVYYRFFGRLVSTAALAAAGQTGQVEASIRSLLVTEDLWFALLAAAAVAFACLARCRAAASRWRFAVLGGVLVVAAAATIPATVTAVEAARDPVHGGQVFGEDQHIRNWGVATVHLFDVARSAEEWRERGPVDQETARRVEAFFRQRAEAAPDSGPFFGVARGMNVILIQVESMQQWVIGTEINHQKVTPFLDQASSTAMYFPEIFDQTAEGRTSDAEFAVLNSLHPLDRGAVSFRREGDHFHALPSVLAEHGYETISAHAFDRGFWNRAVLHPRYGFQHSYFRRELGPGEMIGWGLADDVFLQRMVGHLQEARKPFFAFLITLGLHHPFEGFPEKHKVLDVGDLAGTPLGEYLHNMHYVDESLRHFVASLSEAGLLQHTVIAIYGDHDSGLPPTPELLALAGWRPTAITTQSFDRIPLVIYVPGSGLKGTVKVPGGHIDIAPTLLYLLGLPRPENFLGAALLPERAIPAVRYPGTAALGDRFFVGGGPSQHGCFELSSGSPLPEKACAGLAEDMNGELAVSRLVVLHDLFPLVEGADAR